MSSWRFPASGAAFGLLVALSLTVSHRPSLGAAPASAPTPGIANVRPPDDPNFDTQAALKALQAQIAGHENDPAEKVFKNIQTLDGVPAGRLLKIMEMGYSGSLGVNCTHCHVPGRWSADDKPTKQIARDMVAMMATINGDLLTKIKNLQAEKAMVNCTTCHRGQVRPALNMGEMKR